MKARVVPDADVLVSAVFNPSIIAGHILELVRQNATRFAIAALSQ
jgi:hypothetical protein